MQEEELSLRNDLCMDNFVSVRYILILGLIPINQNLCAVNFKYDL